MIIEIFVDGSSYIDKDYKASSSSYAIFIKDKLIASGGKFHQYGTNNFGESMAILLSLDKIYKLLKKAAKSNKKVFSKPINIVVYTDSYITCETCRTWIYNWVKKYRNGRFLNANGEEVANQDVYKAIYKHFLTNELFNIKFYHINSHIIENKIYKDNMDKIRDYFLRRHNEDIDLELPDQLFSFKKFREAKKTFKEKNNKDISNLELLRLLFYNSYVDNLAKEYLQSGLKEWRERDGKKEKVKEKNQRIRQNVL